MSEYNWCHGPDCHTYETQSRIRGSGDHKVLRTVKIKLTEWNKDHAFKYFCNQGCLMDYIKEHLTSIIAIAPRRQALETPIKVEKEKYENYYYRYSNGESTRVPYQATRTTINRVDNDNG